MHAFYHSVPRILLLAAGFLSTTSGLSAKTAVTTRESFAVEPGSRLSVDVGIGDIRVTTHANPSVTIEVVREVSGRSESREQKLLESDELVLVQRADLVSVRTREVSRRDTLLWVFPGTKVRRSYNYHLTVPEALQLDLKTHAGTIVITGVTGTHTAFATAGDLLIEGTTGELRGAVVGTGKIELIHCEGTVSLHADRGTISSNNGKGSFDLETAQGEITIGGHQGTLSLKTGSGSIAASGIAGAIQAHTTEGTVQVALIASPTAESRLATHKGGVAVSLPLDATVEIDAASEGGSVRSDIPVKSSIEGSSEQLNGSINGGGPLLHLRATGGNVRVRAR